MTPQLFLHPLLCVSSCLRACRLVSDGPPRHTCPGQTRNPAPRPAPTSLPRQPLPQQHHLSFLPSPARISHLEVLRLGAASVTRVTAAWGSFLCGPRPAAPPAWTDVGAWSFAVTLCHLQPGWPSLLTALGAPRCAGVSSVWLRGPPGWTRLCLGPLLPSPSRWPCPRGASALAVPSSATLFPEVLPGCLLYIAGESTVPLGGL